MHSKMRMRRREVRRYVARKRARPALSEGPTRARRAGQPAIAKQNSTSYGCEKQQPFVVVIQNYVEISTGQ